jgi:N6-adenosine-specific RNA methylase IME4
MAEQLRPDLLELNRHPEAEIQHADDFACFSLDDLAQQINDGHQAIRFSVRRLAVHVAQVGAWLTAAKAKCQHGEWLPWLADNCPEITRMTANNYMRLYDKAVSNVNFILHLTPTQAYKALGVVRDDSDPTPVGPVELESLPEGEFRTLVVDPPWQMEKIERDLYPNQHGFDYHTMDLEQIANFPVIPRLAAEDSHLYLWTTHKHLPHAFGIAEQWGFKYECLITWRKNVGFTPYSWMRTTEFALFCRRGSLDLMKLGKRLDFEAKRREHSRKPDEFYDLIAEVSPAPRIDIFSREDRDGFDSWGNEVGRFG